MDSQILQSGIKLLNKEYSERQIAKMLNIDRSTFRYNLKKLNITPKLKQGEWSNKHKQFIGKTKTTYGYVLIKKRNHLSCDKQGYVRRSHLVMEDFIGRLLKKEEVVHHINGIKDDDRIENLRLFTSDKEHRKFHMEGNQYAKKIK